MKIVSDVLGRELTLQVSTSALRTFDKHGGMDRYLLRSRIDKLDQGLSRELRTACELSILNCQQTRPAQCVGTPGRCVGTRFCC